MKDERRGGGGPKMTVKLWSNTGVKSPKIRLVSAQGWLKETFSLSSLLLFFFLFSPRH